MFSPTILKFRLMNNISKEFFVTVLSFKI